MPTRYERLFEGVAMRAPLSLKNESPHAGREGISAADTYEADWGALLERAGKRVKALASPEASNPSSLLASVENPAA